MGFFKRLFSESRRQAGAGAYVFNPEEIALKDDVENVLNHYLPVGFIETPAMQERINGWVGYTFRGRSINTIPRDLLILIGANRCLEVAARDALNMGQNKTTKILLAASASFREQNPRLFSSNEKSSGSEQG
jgi:hypothetical protein